MAVTAGMTAGTMRLSGFRAGSWEAWVLGGIAALFVSRVVVEFTGGWVFSALVPIATIVLSCATVALAALCHRRWLDLGPVSVLAVYLLNPSVDSGLASAVGFAALAGTLLMCCNRGSTRSIDLLIFCVALAVYAMTLAPDVLPYDSGELQLVGPTLDIAHPPGYALYTMLGKLVSLIPLQTPAWRMNLLSALLAACTLVVTGRAARELTGSSRSAFVGVVALAGSTSFWATATTANVRMLTALFCSLLFWLLLRYARTRSTSTLLMAAFVFGLAAIHHGSLIFLARAHRCLRHRSGPGDCDSPAVAAQHRNCPPGIAERGALLPDSRNSRPGAV